MPSFLPLGTALSSKQPSYLIPPGSFEIGVKPAAFLSDSVYDKTGKIGGIDDESEAIGLWCPSGRGLLPFIVCIYTHLFSR